MQEPEIYIRSQKINHPERSWNGNQAHVNCHHTTTFWQIVITLRVVVASPVQCIIPARCIRLLPVLRGLKIRTTAVKCVSYLLRAINIATIAERIVKSRLQQTIHVASTVKLLKHRKVNIARTLINVSLGIGKSLCEDYKLGQRYGYKPDSLDI